MAIFIFYFSKDYQRENGFLIHSYPMKIHVKPSSCRWCRKLLQQTGRDKLPRKFPHKDLPKEILVFSFNIISHLVLNSTTSLVPSEINVCMLSNILTLVKPLSLVPLSNCIRSAKWVKWLIWSEWCHQFMESFSPVFRSIPKHTASVRRVLKL